MYKVQSILYDIFIGIMIFGVVLLFAGALITMISENDTNRTIIFASPTGEIITGQGTVSFVDDAYAKVYIGEKTYTVHPTNLMTVED